ncbi:MAG: LysM peptidoglycan-binding domain-containing protein [Lachnospiraceae bacterium]
MAKEENPEVFGDITFGSDVTALVFELADGAEVLVYDGYQSWSGNDSLVIEFHSPENSDEVTEIFYFGNRTDLKLSKPILWGDIEDYTVYLRFAKVWASTQNSEEDTKVEEPKEEDTKDETPVADDKEEDKSEESVRVDENGTKWYFDEKGEYKLIGKKNDRKCYSTENVYIVKQGDCLWSIARELLGDGKKYTQLFTRNGDIVKRAELIHIGQEIIYTPINQ